MTSEISKPTASAKRTGCRVPPPAGFTYVELLTVFLIISILAAMGAFGLSSYRGGRGLANTRSEAMAFIENARSLAVYSGEKRKVKFDFATQKFWVEDMSGIKKADPVKFEAGVICKSTCPAELVFKATGAVDGGAAVLYTFQTTRSGKEMQLKVHPQTGRVEAL